jgi:antitoxin component YwqK of YwqJK toxin-antitoxin module
MKILYFLQLLLLCGGCATRTQNAPDSITSMQIIDRNGFAETISNKDRIATYKGVDFLSPQPYQKILRVYKRNAQGQSSAKITSYHDNGQLWQYLEVIDGRAHGFYREWFPNGKLKIEAFLIEGLADINDLAQRSWVFDAISRVWNEEGQLLAEIPYQKGVLHGVSHYYYASGALQKCIPYEAGELQGDLSVFDEQGNLLECAPHVAGQKHGIARYYWSKDCILSTETYENGLLKQAHYYDPLGTCISEIYEGRGKQALFKGGDLYALAEYEGGVPEGKVSCFYPDGTLQLTYSVTEGKKNGEEWEYYPSKPGEKPQSKLCVHWHDDLLQGMVKTWYPHGGMESQREIVNGKKQGLCFAWYKNGALMLLEEYENDLLIKGSYFKKSDKVAVSKVEGGKGIATLYSSEGIFMKRIPYEKGKPKIDEDSI